MQDDELERAREEAIARWKRQREQDEKEKSKQIDQYRLGTAQKTWLVMVISGSLFLVAAVIFFVLARVQGGGTTGIENMGLDGLSLACLVTGAVILSIGISLRGKRRK